MCFFLVDGNFSNIISCTLQLVYSVAYQTYCGTQNRTFRNAFLNFSRGCDCCYAIQNRRNTVKALLHTICEYIYVRWWEPSILRAVLRSRCFFHDPFVFFFSFSLSRFFASSPAGWARQADHASNPSAWSRSGLRSLLCAVAPHHLLPTVALRYCSRPLFLPGRVFWEEYGWKRFGWVSCCLFRIRKWAQPIEYSKSLNSAFLCENEPNPSNITLR